MVYKEFMPLEEIRKNILSKYPYKILDIIPVKFKDTDKQRAVYRIETDSSPKCLKKVYYDEGNLLFVYSAMEWLYRHGIYIPHLLPTIPGGRYVTYKKNLFILCDWIDGRKCDYDLDEDICAASRNLGKIHKLSAGFKPIKSSFTRRENPDWYRTFHKRFLNLCQFSNLAYKYNDEFSSIYLQSFDYFFLRAKHSVYLLNKLDLSELSSPLNDNTICHLDYVNKNLIFACTGELYVIDFDKCRIDIPVHDLGTFLKRILKRKTTSWDFSILNMTLQNYQKERKLSITELVALYAYLEFPQKYWKISRDYYNNRDVCSKGMFISMLDKTCQQKDDHDEFCTRFEDYIEKQYGISLK